MTSLSTKKWKSASQGMMIKNPDGFKTVKTFNGILDFIHNKDWQGACHSSSAIFSTLMAAQGVSSTLCLGEVAQGIAYFDHSWVEINSEVFDAAVSISLMKGVYFPPVFRGFDLSTKAETTLEYGKSSGRGYDEHASWIRKIPVATYMDDFPDHPDGLFGIAKDIAKTINLRVSLPTLKKHAETLIWVERP